jgi:RHS repeat-associated protein
MKYVGGNFSQVGASGTVKNHFITDPQMQNKPATKSGYVYIYCSNESNANVFFDNLQVFHTRSPILEETHYYPFGLVMAGISSKAANSLENKRKWNAGSELQANEFSDNSGLELYATFYRSLDPQIGRFWQMDPRPNYSESPYAAMGNNPISYNDPLGDTAVTRWRSGFLGLGAKHEARYITGTWIDSKTRQAVNTKSVRSGTRSIMTDYEKVNSVSAFSPVTDKINSVANSVNLISGGGPETGGSEVNTPKYFSDLKAGVTNPNIDVYISKRQSIGSSVIEGNQSGQLSSYIRMGHELGHVWDILNAGSSTANFVQIPGLSPGISNSEMNGMFWENVLRADARMPLRTMYNFDAARGAELPANINISNICLPFVGLPVQSVTLGSLNMGVTYKFLRIK